MAKSIAKCYVRMYGMCTATISAELRGAGGFIVLLSHVYVCVYLCTQSMCVTLPYCAQDGRKREFIVLCSPLSRQRLVFFARSVQSILGC